MSQNTSYFIRFLPQEFDTWNTSTRIDFYNDNLLGFSALNTSIQYWIADIFSREDIQGLWELFVSMVNNPQGTAEEFFAYVIKTMSEPPTTTPQPSICTSLEDFDKNFVNLYTIPSFVVVIILMFFKRRKHIAPNCCWRKPGIVYPVNFIDEHSRRWAYGAVFAIVSYKVLLLFEQNYYWMPTTFDDPDWSKTWGWLKVFIGILNVLQIGLCFYPMMACIVLRKHILANILGLASIIPWLWATIDVYLQCPILGARDESARVESIFQLVFDVPVFLSYLVVLICFLYDLYLNIHRIVKEKRKVNEMKDQEQKYCESYPVQYVRALMKRASPVPHGFLQKIKMYCTYTKIAGFKFPPRMICTMVVGFLALYKFGTGLGGTVHYIFEFGKYLLDEAKPGLIASNQTDLYLQLDELLGIGQWAFGVSNVLSFLLHIIFMVHMVLCYRQHMMMILKGNHKWHHTYEASPPSQLVAGMRYSGYQIAFLINGYLILMLLLFLVMMLLAYFIIIPLRDGTRSFVIDQIISLWPTLLFGMFTYIIQILMAKYIFLQDQGKYMAINNRRLYHVASFFLFFFNILLGLFSCVKRILISLVFGVIMISRLDKCLLMRGAERFDSGFNTYLGMLTVDVHHNHPVLKAFVEILSEAAVKGKKSAAQINHVDLAKGEVVTLSEKQMVKKRVRNRWWKLLTLINNPNIVVDQLQKDIKERKQNNMDKTLQIDGLGGLGAVFIGEVASDVDSTKL